jgi:hypothetical protein
VNAVILKWGIDMNAFETQRAAFAALIPELTRMAKAKFRDLDAESKDEHVQNTLALCWYRYTSLIRDGRGDEPGIIRSVLWYSIKQIRAGRNLPTGESSKPKDVFAYARRGRLTFERVDLWEYVSDETPIPDAVAFRMDFPSFIGTLNDRQRDIALDLMHGMGTGECAAKHCVTSGAISQTRERIANQYAEFVAA